MHSYPKLAPLIASRTPVASGGPGRLEGLPLGRYAIMLQLRTEPAGRFVEGDRRIMEKLERTKFTRAGAIANERLVEAVLDPDRYPEGTTFIAADQEGCGAARADAVAEHRPLPSSVGTAGRSSPHLAVERLPASSTCWPAAVARSSGQPVVPLPADHRVEIRDRQALAAA